VKYLLLLTNPASEIEQWETLSAEEAAEARAKAIPAWEQLFAYMAEKKIESKGLELQLPSAAKTVQVRDGQTIVSDGPYAETKELIGGYFLVECADLDQAIDLSTRIPVVTSGSVEIRALVE
jgi:hypothetical protein